MRHCVCKSLHPVGSALMRILAFKPTPHLPVYISGAHKSLDALLRGLQRRGHEVGLLCEADSVDRMSGLGWLDGRLEYRALRVRDPLSALPKLIDRFAPDIVIVSGPRDGPAALTICRSKQVPCIQTISTSFEVFEGLFTPDPNVQYIANSTFTALKFASWYGVDCAVLPSIVEPGPLRTVEGSRDCVLFINPAPEKGIYLILEMARKLPRRRFLVATSWSFGADWGDLIRVLAPPNVEWLDATLDPVELYGRARVLLMPSLWEESSGRSAVEAQIAGIPVYAMARGGLPETVGGGGMLFALGGPTELWTDQIEELYVNPILFKRLSMAARSHAGRAENDVDEILNGWEYVCNQLRG